jgi:superfamily I DNA/RNA helicase
VDPNNLSKNRLKAIYEAMFSHYKNVSKFARTTQAYVTAETKAYRKLLEKSYSSYSDFVFKKLKTIGGSYEATLATIKTIKLELESAINELCVDLAHSICTLFNYETNTSIAQLLSKKYRNDWIAKRQKSFDYCTNAFLEFTSTVGESELDCNVIVSLSKSLTGFELMYWNDSHKVEFLDKLKDIKDKLDAYEVKSSLGETETRMTLKTSDGQEKSVVFDRSDLSPLSQTIKNKINATFNNYGMSVTYDDKVQVLLSLIEDLMEGN